MPKNKRPVPRKPAAPVLDDTERLAQTLADLALDLAEQAADDEQSGRPVDTAGLSLKEDAFNKLVRNALRKKNDELLYLALEHALEADVDAYALLRERLGEASASVLLHREGAPSMEVNAFAVPVFVHSTGGLKQEQGFQDPDSFDRLVASFVSEGLESPHARVVLISHAYDLNEFDRLTYGFLNEMVREAGASMTEKKLLPAPALERSMAGWSPSEFGADEHAVELRFLLGFALKAADDPFYRVPQEEAAADAYFAARMERYRAWTDKAADLVARCLALDPAGLSLNFMYQDLPFGAREQGLAELEILHLLSVAGAAADAAGGPGQVRAQVQPLEVEHALVLRIHLLGPDGAVLGTLDKAVDAGADVQEELDNVADALASIGIKALERIG